MMNKRYEYKGLIYCEDIYHVKQKIMMAIYMIFIGH